MDIRRPSIEGRHSHPPVNNPPSNRFVVVNSDHPLANTPGYSIASLNFAVETLLNWPLNGPLMEALQLTEFYQERDS